MNHPTALIVYNRSQHLAHVLAALQKHKLEPLYIFSDGPKDDKDAERVGAVRELILHIEWARPEICLQDHNKGLAWSVMHAVDTVLAQHDTVIVLEDDCVVGPWFYEFMNQCLARYADNERVMSVNGYTMPIPSVALGDYPWDLYFNPRVGCWGWATWRRAWSLYDRNIKGVYVKAKEMGIMERGGRDVEGIVRARIEGRLDAWTGGWILAHYIHDAYCIYPTISHTQNIGMNGSGVHCTKTGRWDTPLAQEKPTRYPGDVSLHRPILDHFMEYYGGYDPGR